ncbi:MAG: hypothetical protein IT372_16470 [Polyangiaceae bacterium]|nr:hypothetical protein [Polyangiaceae bacterium]
MTFKNALVSFGLMAFIGAFTVGCGADCEGMCEDAKECEGAADTGDCAKACEDAEKAAEDKGCSDQYDDLLSCMDDQDDICTAGTGCTSEATAYGTCLSGQ